MIGITTFDGVPLEVEITSEGPIASGGTSRVFKGEFFASDHLWVVAVKVLTGRIDSVQQQLMDRELRTLHKLHNEEIVNEDILAFVGASNPGSRYTAIVSLYMQNGNLLEYLKQHKNAKKGVLLKQVAGAVTYLHTKEGLVHGDLKCANVLISDFGDALLTDFGLSTVIEKAQAQANSQIINTFSDLGNSFVVDPDSGTIMPSGATTATGICNMFTLRFAAPEILLGTAGKPGHPRSKTQASDVFAFGMLVLEAVTEQPPWCGLSAQAVLLNVCLGRVPPRPKLDGEYGAMSNLWWNACLWCWTFEARKRPSMRSMSQILQDFATENVRVEAKDSLYNDDDYTSAWFFFQRALSLFR